MPNDPTYSKVIVLTVKETMTQKEYDDEYTSSDLEKSAREEERALKRYPLVLTSDMDFKVNVTITRNGE